MRRNEQGVRAVGIWADLRVMLLIYMHYLDFEVTRERKV